MTSRKMDYVHATTRGAGFMPWQSRRALSARERAFRQRMEARKDSLLAGRMAVTHPVLLSDAQRETAWRNIRTTAWGETWFEGLQRRCDAVLPRVDQDLERMIPALTPTVGYGFTCPNCVGRRSQEGMGISMFDWTPDRPDAISCKVCGQILPDERYPETGVLECPRRRQTFTYYLNDAERSHPEDRSGRYAWRWVGHPMHVSFSGIARKASLMHMIHAARELGVLYQLSAAPRYAVAAAAILERLSETVSDYLYHDYWDTVADCDPLYAAWHDRSLPLAWKRHPVESAFDGDRYTRAAMLQGYWGAGRIRACDGMLLDAFCLAYDLTAAALDDDGRPVWDEARRRRVERDLLLDYAFGAEPFVGGPGKAENVSNKAPYVYLPFAAMGMILGLPDYVDVALTGYEALRDRSFLFDGFSRESPAYTAMYLNNMVMIPDRLEGYHWPATFGRRRGCVHLFQDDPKLRRIMRTQRDSLRGNGKFVPLSDTLVVGAPPPLIFEVGLKRDPEAFAGILPAVYRAQANVMGTGETQEDGSPAAGRSVRSTQPGEYAVFNLTETMLNQDHPEFHETVFPAWRTAILRHGQGSRAAEAALAFNPRGGHRHADQLAIYYADGGQPILGELGYVGDSAMLSWGGSTESHNLVLVDDHGQIDPADRQDPHGPDLRLMVSTPVISVVDADARAYAQCSRYRRRLVLIKGPEGRSLLLDIFRVTGGNRHTYRMFSEVAASDARDGQRWFDGIPMPPEAALPDFGGSVAREHVFGLRDPRHVDQPPPAWRAIWRQADRAYRLHCLCDTDRVEASHGPGQETLTQVGRRVRYLDVIRCGAEPLASAFVMLHEPGGANGAWPVHDAQRIPLPASAGPDAVALRLETAWGDYCIFNDVEQPTLIEGMPCQGIVGVACRQNDGGGWRLVCGESMWQGEVAGYSETCLTAAAPPPAAWPGLAEGATVWVCTGGDSGVTGFPVRAIRGNTIDLACYPLQPCRRFSLPSVCLLTFP